MIQTLEPDKNGRVTILKYLHMCGWVPGQGIEIEFVKPVDLMKSKKPGGIQ
ncbi:MAG: hypothetical protein ACT6FG_00385 [Methanosarcinaceae archaeon]